MAFHFEGRAVTAKTAVHSKDGTFLFYVDHDGFLHLTGRGIVKILGNQRKIHRLQLSVDLDQADPNDIFERDPSFGRKYTREEHVAGMYYIHQLKHIPAILRTDFTAVLDSVTC